MGEHTEISWTDHTFNPWRGCQRVSPGCEHCYAEAMSKRNPAVLGSWGPQGARVVASAAYWREPLKWNRAAEAAGVRRRVFCASLADVFEDYRGLMVDTKGCAAYGSTPSMQDARRKLFDLIRKTPALDWLLLTKRPENIARMLPPDWGTGYPNVWLGTTVEDARRADERIPALAAVPAVVHFLSCEPLLGPVTLFGDPNADAGGPALRTNGYSYETDYGTEWDAEYIPSVEWVIVGGESGAGARAMVGEWLTGLVADCLDWDVPVFVKQLGGVRDKRAKLDQIPEDMRYREFPTPEVPK